MAGPVVWIASVHINLSWRYVILVAALAMVIGLQLTGYFGDNSMPRTAVQEYLPVVTPTPIPPSIIEADVLRPGAETGDSALVMVQGEKARRLVIWPVDGGPAEEVDRHVGLWPLLLDPTRTRLLYSTQGALMVLDRDDRRATIVGALPGGGQVTAAQWSPDGTRVAYVVRTPDAHRAYYAPADGSQPAQELVSVPPGLPLDVAWLPDGRPVSIYLSVAARGGLVARYEAFDPTLQASIIVPPTKEIIQPYAPRLAPDGTQQVYPMRSWEQASSHSGCRETALGVMGPEWWGVMGAGSGKPRDVAFEVNNVYLDQPRWLLDGRIVMRGIADIDCPFGATGIYVARLGEEPQLLVHTHNGYAQDQKGHLIWGPAYAISPDQNYAAWAENDIDTNRSAIRMIALDGGAPQTLYRTPRVTPDQPFHYRDTYMILNFVWLP